MAIDASGLTRAQYVYEHLRSGILRGEYHPGSPLRLQELSENFGVSMSVVREALTRLGERHLVTNSPNAGFRVVEVSEEDLLDLVNIRIELEGLALVRSIEKGDVDWAAQVISAHYVLENTPFRNESAHDPGTTDEWSIAHDSFHDSLGLACESPRLISYTRMLRDSAEVYRQISGVGGQTPTRDIAGEHRELMELSTQRKPEEARLSLMNHLRATASSAAEALRIGNFV